MRKMTRLEAMGGAEEEEETRAERANPSQFYLYCLAYGRQCVDGICLCSRLCKLG